MGADPILQAYANMPASAEMVASQDVTLAPAAFTEPVGDATATASEQVGAVEIMALRRAPVTCGDNGSTLSSQDSGVKRSFGLEPTTSKAEGEVRDDSST